MDNNGFDLSHEGKHGIGCTGLGCDCDEKRYPRSHGYRKSGDSKLWQVIMLIGVIVSIFNELLGVIIVIISLVIKSARS